MHSGSPQKTSARLNRQIFLKQSQIAARRGPMTRWGRSAPDRPPRQVTAHHLRTVHRHGKLHAQSRHSRLQTLQASSGVLRGSQSFRMAITHNAPDQEFTTTRHGLQAELAYSRPAEGVIDFTHTFVDEGLRGQGVAEELARAGLDFARQEHLKVKTSCTFMAGFVGRHHAEYTDLLA